MSYGQLVVVRELTKSEARRLEQQLSKKPHHVSFDGWKINVHGVSVGTIGHNVQCITVRGTA